MKKPILSFEIFPPKKTSGIETVFSTIGELKNLAPDFISVTYGAGGSGSENHTLEIARRVIDSGVKTVAHLPCINYTKDEIRAVLSDFRANGITDILALRGDICPDRTPKTDFAHASDLITFIKQQGDFRLFGACYPEGHPQSTSLSEDIRYLKHKTDCGAEHLLSQLFFDNAHFYRFLELASAAGISATIEAGIMPVTNKKQIERMVSICGATPPKAIIEMLDRYGDDPDSLREAGIAYAAAQIADLIKNGVDGIHLYTMNSPYVAEKIISSVRGLPAVSA